MSDAAGNELNRCSVTREGEKSSGKQRRGHHSMPTRGKNRLKGRTGHEWWHRRCCF